MAVSGQMVCCMQPSNGDTEDGAAGGEGGGVRRFATLGKDPTVRTDFLPDKDRQRQEEELREQLKKEWGLRQVSAGAG